MDRNRRYVSRKGRRGRTAQRGFLFAQFNFLEAKFSKTNSSHIDDFCPRRADSEEEGILIAASQKVSARQRGKGSGDSPRCTVNRDATPPGGLSGAEWQVGGQTSELCAPVFAPTLEWENRDQAFCWQGHPSRSPRERKRGFSAIRMLHNSPN